MENVRINSSLFKIVHKTLWNEELVFTSQSYLLFCFHIIITLCELSSGPLRSGRFRSTDTDITSFYRIIYWKKVTWVRLSIPLALQWWLFCLLLSTIIDNNNILINFTYSNIACCNLDCCMFLLLTKFSFYIIISILTRKISFLCEFMGYVDCDYFYQRWTTRNRYTPLPQSKQNIF